MAATRRAFAKTLAVATAALPLVRIEAAEEPPLAGAMTQVVRAQSGQHLTPAELAEIEKDFARSAKGLDALRAFPLANGDEPDFTFAARIERA